MTIGNFYASSPISEGKASPIYEYTRVREYVLEFPNALYNPPPKIFGVNKLSLKHSPGGLAHFAYKFLYSKAETFGVIFLTSNSCGIKLWGRILLECNVV